jgi:hypothetical protein
MSATIQAVHDHAVGEAARRAAPAAAAGAAGPTAAASEVHIEIEMTPTGVDAEGITLETAAGPPAGTTFAIPTAWTRPGLLGALSVSHSKYVLYDACVWARSALIKQPKTAVSGPRSCPWSLPCPRRPCVVESFVRQRRSALNSSALKKTGGVRRHV